MNTSASASLIAAHVPSSHWVTGSRVSPTGLAPVIDLLTERERRLRLRVEPAPIAASPTA